jgi:hypothetical protein
MSEDEMIRAGHRFADAIRAEVEAGADPLAIEARLEFFYSDCASRLREASDDERTRLLIAALHSGIEQRLSAPASA